MNILLPFRFAALFLYAALLLSGCCANNVCDCKDAQADVIKLVFAKEFSAADLDTIVVQRYPLVIRPNTKPETVTLIRTAAQLHDTLSLNNATPFAQAGATRLDGYKYVVRYYAVPKRRPAIALIVDKVVLKGSLNGNGCCTCYENQAKVISFRKDSTTAEAADSVYDLKLRARSVITVRK